MYPSKSKIGVLKPADTPRPVKVLVSGVLNVYGAFEMSCTKGDYLYYAMANQEWALNGEVFAYIEDTILYIDSHTYEHAISKVLLSTDRYSELRLITLITHTK